MCLRSSLLEDVINELVWETWSKRTKHFVAPGTKSALGA